MKQRVFLGFIQQAINNAYPKSNEHTNKEALKKQRIKAIVEIGSTDETDKVLLKELLDLPIIQGRNQLPAIESS